MSWYIKTIGSPADIKAAVRKDNYVPASIVAAVDGFCGMAGPDQKILVETIGQVGDGIGSMKLEISTVLVAAEPPAQVTLVTINNNPPVMAAVMAAAVSEAGDAMASEIKKEVAAGTLAV